MRNVVIFCFLILTTTGCKKSDKIPDSEANATVNGEQWETIGAWMTTASQIENKLDLNISFKEYGYSGTFVVSNLTKAIGNQLLKRTNYDSLYLINAVYINSQEEDVTGDEYDILEADSANNWVNITSAKDDFTKDIRGTFSATLVRTKKFMNSPYPDTLRFRNGTFYISKLWD